MKGRSIIAAVATCLLACASKGPPPALEVAPIRDADASTTASFAPLPPHPFDAPTSRLTKEHLSAEECDRLADLTYHLWAVKAGMAPPPARMPKRARTETEVHTRESCMRETTRGQYECAMKAKDWADLRGCMRTMY